MERWLRDEYAFLGSFLQRTKEKPTCVVRGHDTVSGFTPCALYTQSGNKAKKKKKLDLNLRDHLCH